MLYAICSGKELTAHPYYAPVADILEHRRFQLLRQYRHHIRTTRFQHSVNVSYYSYRICACLRWDAVSAARAGLLHDFYFYETIRCKKCDKSQPASHLSVHPVLALANASESFSLSPAESDCIVRHMWPFTRKRPRSKEGIVIALVDKCIAIVELLSFRSRKR